MTRQREYNQNCTDFSLWLRKQQEIDSKLGYVATDVDFVWTNYHSGKWMLIEEKTGLRPMTYSQSRILENIANAASNDCNFCGMFLLQFENRTPDDGKFYINHKLATRGDLLNLLMFSDVAIAQFYIDQKKLCLIGQDPY